MSGDRDVAAIAGPEAPVLPLRAIVAVIVAGVVGAALLPESRPGASFTIVTVFVAAAVVAPYRRITGHELVFGGTAFVLASMASLRTAEWILAVDFLAALGLSCFAVTSARTWKALVVAPFVVLGKIRWIPGSLARPLVERARTGGSAALGSFVRSAVVTILLVVVFGTLFVSADAAFAQLANDVLIPNVRVDLAFARVATFAIVTLFAGALVLARALVGDGPDAVTSVPAASARKLSEWVLPIAVLDGLFAIFVVVQMTVLFGGRHHVELTPGLTYAEYARQGFFQLLAVAALVLVVVTVTTLVSRPHDRRTKHVAQGLLGTLCLLTLVVLASAWYRLGVYEDAYGLTRLRVSVYGAIAWLGAIFMLLMVAGIAWRGEWLSRVIVGLTAVGLIGFTFASPDALIAQRNVQRFEATGSIDLSYLATLSDDAIPALAQLPVEHRDCVLSQIASNRGTRDDLGWSDANLARARARVILERSDVPLHPPAGCISY